MIKEIKEALDAYNNRGDSGDIRKVNNNAPEYLRYLLNEIERKDKALQDVREAVWDEMVPSKLAAKVNLIVEEGLK